jgi:hypothetical protein
MVTLRYGARRDPIEELLHHQPGGLLGRLFFVCCAPDVGHSDVDLIVPESGHSVDELTAASPRLISAVPGSPPIGEKQDSITQSPAILDGIILVR